MDDIHFFVDDMTLSLCLFIFPYHGHKYTTLQQNKRPIPAETAVWWCNWFSVDLCWFSLVAVDILARHHDYTLKTVLYSHNLFSHLSCVAAAKCIIDEMCVCVCLSSATRAHRVTFWRFHLDEREDDDDVKRAEKKKKKKKIFPFWLAFNHSLPSFHPPMLWMWLDAGTFAAQPSIWLYWKWEASIRVSHSFSPGFRKPLASSTDGRKKATCATSAILPWVETYTRA